MQQATPTAAGSAFRSGRRRSLAFIAYGLVAALLGTLYLSTRVPEPADWPIQGHRVELIEDSTGIIEDGGPPLVVEARDSAPGDLQTVGATGNYPGLFVYVPTLAAWFDLEPLEGVKLLFLISFFVPMAFYPLVFHRLTGNAPVALLSPALLVAAVVAAETAVDLYWIMAWVPLALLPLLLFALKSPHRGVGFAALMTAAIGASYASSIRGLAGLGIVIGALAVLLFAFSGLSRPRRALGVVAIVAAYLSISTGGMALADNAAHDYAGERLVADSSSLDAGRAHIAYMGLGYLPNESNIAYIDSVTVLDGRRIDPDLELFGPGFAEIAEDLYLDEVRSDPWGYADLTVTKLAVELTEPGFNSMVFVGFAAALLVFFGRFKRLTAWALGLSIPLLAVGFAPGLIGVPYPNFVLGGTGTIGALEILLVAMGATLMIERWPRVVAQLRPETEAKPVLLAGAALILGFTLLVIVSDRLGDALIAALAAFVALALVAGTSGSIRNRFEQARRFVAARWAAAGLERGERWRLATAVALLIVVPLTMLAAERRALGVPEAAAEWSAQRAAEIDPDFVDEQIAPVLPPSAADRAAEAERAIDE